MVLENVLVRIDFKKNMNITKSDFLRHLQCYKYLWLYKNRKDLIPKDIESEMERKFDDGYEVEEYAYLLFPNGVDAKDGDFKKAIVKTSKLVSAKKPAIFQPTFSVNNLFCRSDIIVFNSKTDHWDLYEVKSATEVKDIYIYDLAFQNVCIKDSGLKVGKTYVIHVNNSYIRHGEIEPKKLLTVEDVSEEVEKIANETRDQIETAWKVLTQTAEPTARILKQCHDEYTCAFVDYCWRGLPEHSIYDISFSKDKLNKLLDMGVLRLEDVPAEMITAAKAQKHHEAVKTNKVFIDKKGIEEELSELEYPLYFLDYETFSPAIPLFDGYRPYQRIVFQYSLHVQEKPDAEVKHYEFLWDKFSDPTKVLADSLLKIIGPKGCVIAWNMGFEAGCNKEMGKRYPESANFFIDVNGRMVDLMNSFKKGYYVDRHFKNSASLKAVLPVLVPKLSYDELSIHEGMTASNFWRLMIDPATKKEKAKKIYDNLLKYCELDTLAMVEILRVLKSVI